jgi:hypothetical protein
MHKKLIAMALAGMPFVASGGRDGLTVHEVCAQPIPFDDDFGWAKPTTNSERKRPFKSNTGTAAAKRAAKKRRNRK